MRRRGRRVRIIFRFRPWTPRKELKGGSLRRKRRSCSRAWSRLRRG